MQLDRRGFLKFGSGALALAILPKFALAATSATDSRFLLVLLRGGLDGMHLLQAQGDPAFAALRGTFVHAQGQPAALPLDGDFSLHGSLAFSASLFAQRQLLPVVAVAPPYRQRSHFEAQDCVENGTAGTGGTSGWLNRCVASMPGSKGLALSAVMPPPALSLWLSTPHMTAAPARKQRMKPMMATPVLTPPSTCGRALVASSLWSLSLAMMNSLQSTNI